MYVKKLFSHIVHLPYFQYLIPDKLWLEIKFKHIFGKKLNLSDPKSFSEKLQWLKLYDRNPLYTNLADKYQVRSYIEKAIGKEYLVPLIGVYDTFDEINFQELPIEFVLKPNNSSGDIYISRDKSNIDYGKLKKEVNIWLKQRYYWINREWPYKNIKPKIICEKFISDRDNTPDDYKVLCFNGKAKLIEVHRDRFTNHHLDFYDVRWNKTSIAKEYAVSDFIYHKPKELEKMIQLSEKLAADMVHVRIDWFVVNDKLYFGEITLYDGAGFQHFRTEEDDCYLGSLINLQTEKK